MSYRSRSWSRLLADVIVVALLSALLIYVSDYVQNLNGDETEEGPFRAKDGDSLAHEGRDIRLYGIDAPELNQRCTDTKGSAYDCGKEARAALRKLIRGRTITCSTRDRDRYGRNVSVCSNGAQELNREMVRQGWAIAYRQHSRAYVKDENLARTSKRGIWQGSFDVPEEFRNGRRRVEGGFAGTGEDD